MRHRALAEADRGDEPGQQRPRVGLAHLDEADLLGEPVEEVELRGPPPAAAPSRQERPEAQVVEVPGASADEFGEEVGVRGGPAVPLDEPFAGDEAGGERWGAGPVSMVASGTATAATARPSG